MRRYDRRSRPVRLDPRRRQPDAVQVPTDVEVLVVHPDRMIKIQRLSAIFSRN
ncbi:hypothetical protein I553_8115 [Mycobacterium xenopi 4042]|uniref:Uncharacterized protein n=1 Tax=Mycobacterium xenopi 4042 TaxID=1299334 RepID=X8DDQ8_MYCXE|nr:hypothetical protein I553_8115 [Mycobacterium xenopi 4042]